MQCAESLRVQAYFDREVDALAAAEIERHVEHCSECRELLQDLEKVRSALRNGISFDAAPAALRTQILEALHQEGALAEDGGTATTLKPRATRPARQPRVLGKRWFWSGALSGIGGGTRTSRKTSVRSGVRLTRQGWPPRTQPTFTTPGCPS